MSTYVMSDVHGLKDRYDAMLEALALKEEDTLYILCLLYTSRWV